MIELGVNIDHFATIRNARRTEYPDVTKAAINAIKFGANFVTIHLREDRRHIVDQDVFNIKKSLLDNQLNLEIAATDEMAKIVQQVKPYAVCIVPEKRHEITTEGGLDLINTYDQIKAFINKVSRSVKKITLFVDPNTKNLDITTNLGVNSVELHTGEFANTESEMHLNQIRLSAIYAKNLSIEVNAGHGLTFKTAKIISKIPNITSLNIGHFIVSESLFIGLEACIKKMIVEIRD